MKWHDLNADGVKDAEEPGLPGWTIYVDYNENGSHDIGEPSAVTDSGGMYTITGVAIGTWQVREVGQNDWFQSYPADPPYHTDTFTSGETERDNNFGNYQLASKSGTKFHDLNANGVWDDLEPGLEGWTIYVDVDGSGTLTGGDLSDETDVNGEYLIEGIMPGVEYTVREVLKADWFQSFPADPGYYTETFISGVEETKNDFGNWTWATKSGTKFEDLDADGQPRKQANPDYPDGRFTSTITETVSGMPENSLMLQMQTVITQSITLHRAHSTSGKYLRLTG